MAVVQWTTAFLATPAGSDTPDGGDDRIRELKETLDSALDKEHTLDASSPPAIAAQGWHREGSAIAYYQTTAPTNRPDGATALDTSDDGRLWVDSDDGTLDYYTGSAFADLKLPEVDLIRDHLDKSADYTILDDDANTIFVTTAATDRTITLPTAADNAGRVITVKKVDSGVGTVTVDGEGAETIDGATTVVVSTQYGLWRGMCDGTTWHTMEDSRVITAVGDVRLQMKVFEIGDWNMDTTTGVDFDHGLDWDNIRAIDVILRSDTGVASRVQPGFYSGDLEVNIASDKVYLTRIASGTYDSASYNETSYNRGWVTIWYAV